MKRLRGHSGLPGRWCLLAALCFGAAGAAPGLQPSPEVPPLPPAQGVTPVQTKPPTCRPEVQADTNCRSGFRTVQVCYQGSRVVSTTIGQCVPPATVKPGKPGKPPKPPKPPKVPE
jgi:hypothetical protein